MSHDKTQTTRLTEDEFLMAIIHDIRRHLRTSVVRTQMVERELNSQISLGVRSHLDQIIAAGKDMNALLGRLSDYASASSFRNDRPPGDISLLFASALRFLDHRKRDAEIDSLVLERAAIQTPFEMEIVLRELLDNALKFRQGPVKVTVLVERAAGDHVVGIKDNGIGFDPQYRDRIFLPLERLHPQDLYGGHGMGLAISQRILQALGGRLWSDSQLNGGSTFWFTVPA